MARRGTAAEPAAAQRDGRAERSERTRDAVVDALLALFEEGDLRPTAPRIAERAGVALRTVFHHFEDMEVLYALASDRQVERHLRTAARIPRDGPLDERIDALAAERARVHEAISPVRRAASLSEPFSKTIASRLKWIRDRGRDELARVFSEELAMRPPAERRELLEALTVAASWSAWESLRQHQGLTLPQARRAMQRTLRALLNVQ